MSRSETRTENMRDAVIRATTFEPQPILLIGGAVISRNPYMGDWETADVLLGGGRVVGVGPGLLTAASDDNMLVVDCSGCVILPSRADFSVAAGAGEGTLTPGVVADVAVLRVADAKDVPAGPVIDRPTHLDIVFDNGAVTVWDGSPVDDSTVETSGVPSDGAHDYVGMWIDDTGFLHQELTAGGRYDETRGGRVHAYEGRYWITGDRIEYLDDLGFWAHGDFRDGVLYHAGYRLTRA